MNGLSEIRDNALRMLSNPSQREMCVALIDQIGDHLEASQLRPWTYQAISEWVNVNPRDPLFFDCVNLLATSPLVKALELNLLFFDPADPEDIGTPLEADQIQEVFELGTFHHPVSGLPVPDFKKHLVIYFTPAPEIRDGDRA